MAKPTAVPPSAAAAAALSPTYAEIVETIGAEVAQYSRETFEHAGETARGLISARTLEDVVRLQTDFAQRSFADFIARSAKLSELGRSLAGAGVEAWAAHAKV